MDTMDAPTDTPVGAAPAPAGDRRGITFEAIAIIAFFLALAAAILAVFAMALATRSIDEVRNAPGGGAPAGVAVSLTEFSISPSPLTAAQDSTLVVTNDGAVPHDLAVEGLQTPELAAGETAQLDLTGLEPGTYEVICQIAGHKESGMATEITIG